MGTRSNQLTGTEYGTLPNGDRYRVTVWRASTSYPFEVVVSLPGGMPGVWMPVRQYLSREADVDTALYNALIAARYELGKNGE